MNGQAKTYVRDEDARLPLDARTVLDNALELHPGEDQDDVAVLVAHAP